MVVPRVISFAEWNTGRLPPVVTAWTSLWSFSKDCSRRGKGHYSKEKKHDESGDEHAPLVSPFGIRCEPDGCGAVATEGVPATGSSEEAVPTRRAWVSIPSGSIGKKRSTCVVETLIFTDFSIFLWSLDSVIDMLIDRDRSVIRSEWPSHIG